MGSGQDDIRFLERVHSRLIHDLTREIEQPTMDWYKFFADKLTEWRQQEDNYVGARRNNQTPSQDWS